MTEKNLNDEKSAGSSPVDVKQAAAQPPSPATDSEKDTAIAALQAELNNVKEVLKSIESKSQPSNQPSTNRKPSSDEAMKLTVQNDFRKIDELVSLGKLNALQGTSLKSHVLQKAFGSVYDTKGVPPQSQQPQPINGDTFTEFEKSNPDFFNSDARNLVKSFITNGFDTVLPDELTKIAELIEALEQSAITQYEQSKAREQSLQQTNELAKKRLASTALTGSKPSGESTRVFTREEIGRMTTDEFRKHESAIMQQLKSGAIK